MRKLLLSLLTFTLSLSLTAQTTLKGTIVDKETNNPIAGATITLANQSVSSTTNQKGEFTFLFLEAIDEEMIIEAQDYVASVELIQLNKDQVNELEPIMLESDIAKQTETEILLTLAEQDLNDDEGVTQTQNAAASATTDVYNSATGFSWSSARYKTRGYEGNYESNYINGLNFNTAERGTFSFASMGGLNEASRYSDPYNSITANSFTFGGIGKSTNYMMNASRYAQGWRVGAAACNRTYKTALRASYSSGPLKNGWQFIGQLAFRFSPYIDAKDIIGEGTNYYSLGYFFSAEKKWDNGNSLNITTFGSPTKRSSSAAVTQEIYDLTGSIYYNPSWGYQNGHVRNSKVVKSYDPTIIVNYDWQIDENQKMKFAVGYHYSMYSNSAIQYYNSPDPRPDYYRNLPSFLWDGQIVGPSSAQFDSKNGYFISKSGGKDLGDGFIGHDGKHIGPTVDETAYNALVDVWQSRDNNATQINWDAMYAANYANNAIDKANGTATSAKYMLERRHNNIQEAAANINYVNTKYDHLKMTLGIEGKFSQGIHFSTIDDLLGANQWIDADPYADRDIKELATNIGMTQAEMKKMTQNDLANIDRKIYEGDKFGYDYRINMGNAKVWFQNEWNWHYLDLYYALQGSFSSMQRTTDMVNGRAWYLAKLKSGDEEKYLGPNAQQILNDIANEQLKSGRRYYGTSHYFFDPAFKVGLNYKINGRNFIKFNAIAETKAPYARDSYISQRIHDRVTDEIYIHDKANSLNDFYAASQKIAGGDLTYEFKFKSVRGRITGYFTQFWDGSKLNTYYDDEARTLVNQSITGLDSRHYGLEAAAAVPLGGMFTLTGVVNVGSHKYTSDAYCVTTAENGMPLAKDAAGNNQYETRDYVLLKGLRVASGPQVNASLKLSFFYSMWFADVTLSYHDWNYMDVSPARRMKGLFTGTRADGTPVDAWYGNTLTNAIATTDGAALAADMSNAQMDENGVPVLVYPYSIMSQQETLSATNPLNRFMLNAGVGHLFYFKRGRSLSVNISVTNLLNNTHFKTGGYQQARMPLATQTGSDKKYITANAWKFPSKYYYTWGTNFYLTLTYKF